MGCTANILNTLTVSILKAKEDGDSTGLKTLAIQSRLHIKIQNVTE